MANIKVDFTKNTGKIKPMHGVGQPPVLWNDYCLMHYIKEADIPYCRLHDVGGWFGGNLYADIPNIFRDFDADPYDPKSYDFLFTDEMITAIHNNGAETFFRLGVTIENFARKKAYRIFPPKDNKKWAVICEHIIKHYNEGWANGYHYDIKYWEIWNEPDNNPDMLLNEMWRGTKEQYFELYNVASKHLKEKFPDIKIGGYACSNFYVATGTKEEAEKTNDKNRYYLVFFDEFLEYIKKNNCPLDFFSWHSYDGIERTKRYAEYARKRLDEAGFTETETTCNEWNFGEQKRGTMEHAAVNTASLIMMQHSPLDSSMFYDAGLTSVYGGIINPLTKTPFPLYYGFKAYGALYTMETEIESYSDDKNVYVLSAVSGKTGGILLVNIGDEVEIDLELNGQSIKECQAVIQKGCMEGDMEACELPKTLAKNSVYFIKTEK